MTFFYSKSLAFFLALSFLSYPLYAAKCGDAFQCYEAAIVKIDIATKRFEQQTSVLRKENIKLSREVISLKTTIAELRKILANTSEKSSQKIAAVEVKVNSNKVAATNNAQSIGVLKKFVAKLKRNVNSPRSEITVHDGHWGRWTGKKFCPTGQYVCGLRSRVESNGHKDDTAMNSVRLSCCSF